MRFGFVTCVQIGLSCMDEIYREGGKLDLAITLPDDVARDKSGRVYLDTFCNKRKIHLIKTPNVNNNEVIEAALDLDWLFIIGWSQIARERLLDAPKCGVLGIHPTLLPVGRGRAAIPWAILKGLDETGVTLFKLDTGVDTGPIVAQRRIELASDETASGLYEKVNDEHRALIRDAWPRLASGEVEFSPQDDSAATVWPGRKPEDGEILRSMTVYEVDRLVRAVTRPYPGAFLDQRGHRLRVWAGAPGMSGSGVRIDCADGVFTATDTTVESIPA